MRSPNIGTGRVILGLTIDVPILPHFREAGPMPMAVFKLGNTVVGLRKRQPLIERGMGVRLTRQDEVKALYCHSIT